MNKVTEENAFQIGWLVAELKRKGLNVDPIVVGGDYTDTVNWRAESPTGHFRDVHLTINPNPDGS